MKTLARLLICFGLLTALEAQAQPRREFNQAELDALLAPVALYPDSLLMHILTASTRPYDVAQAARWSRLNPQLSGDAAVQAAQPWVWHPSVAALTAFPDVLIRMDENPQWLRDLGDAWQGSEPYVMETVQQLRRRAEAAGNLRSDDRQQVYRQGETVVVQPVVQQVVYAPYYNPLVVFGTWWWTSYRPVVWRPWPARPVYVHPAYVRPVYVRPVYVRPAHVYGAPVNVPIRPVSQPVPRPQAAPVIVRPHVVARPQVTERPQVQHHAVARPAPAAIRPHVSVQQTQHHPVARPAPIVRPAPRALVQHVGPKPR
jgi:hypothetical protein